MRPFGHAELVWVLVSSGKTLSRCTDFPFWGFLPCGVGAFPLVCLRLLFACGMDSSAALHVLGEARLQGVLASNPDMALPEACSQAH